MADEFIVVEILGVFAVMFVGIVVAVLWFTHADTKVRSGKELKAKQMDIIDRHWNEMVRIECPYCKTVYRVGEPACPGCGANTKKILFPEIPE